MRGKLEIMSTFDTRNDLNTLMIFLFRLPSISCLIVCHFFAFAQKINRQADIPGLLCE